MFVHSFIYLSIYSSIYSFICVCLFGTSGRIGLQRGLPQGENTVFLKPFVYQRSFYQDRLGTNIGKALICTAVFRKVVREEPSFIPYFRTGAKNACYLFAMPLYTQNEIVLTRQARDKHNIGESSTGKRETFVFRSNARD